MRPLKQSRWDFGLDLRKEDEITSVPRHASHPLKLPVFLLHLRMQNVEENEYSEKICEKISKAKKKTMRICALYASMYDRTISHKHVI